MFRSKYAAITLFLMASSPAVMAAEPSHQGGCGRTCLLETTNRYLEGLLHNSPAQVPVSSRVRATENGNDVALGSGSLWGRAVRFQYRQTWVDPTTQSAIFFGTAANGPHALGDNTPVTWWWYEVRLTMPNGQISEVEEITWQAPPIGVGSNASQFTEGDSRFEAAVPYDERMSREELIRVADQYWDALGSTTPSRGTTVPFSPDCQRLEVGFYTTNYAASTSCVSRFEDTTWSWAVSNRRYYVVDTTRGVVAGIGMFAGNGRPSFAVPEAFKIENGVIRKLVANFNPTGVQTKSGWSDLHK